MDAHLELLNPATRALIEEKRANEARRAFLRFIFHKVRTPLNSLTMGIEILGRNDRLVEAEIESLLMMKDASSFMTETFDDILNIQKIVEGKLDVELAPFSFRDAISKVCLILTGPATAKGIQFKHIITTIIPEILIGNRFCVEHVYLNLLSNAIKYSPYEGRILTQVTFQPSTESPNILQVTVSISDQGKGISQEKQRTLFTTSSSPTMNRNMNRTQQLPPPINNNQMMQEYPLRLDHSHNQGLAGEGLRLCQQLLELHGGTIRCLSEVGIGSTFIFSLPLQLQLLPTNNIMINNTVLPDYSLNIIPDYRLSISLVNSTYVHRKNDLLEDKSLRSQDSIRNRECNVKDNDENKNSTSSTGNQNAMCNNSHRKILEELSSSYSSETNIHHHHSLTRARTLSHPSSYINNSNHHQNDNDNDYQKLPLLTNRIIQGHHATFRGPVLVVDDMNSNRKMLSILLGKSGVISSMAEDGDEAVAMIQSDLTHYHMILMDNMMPHMNGAEAAKILRQLGYQGLIIGITGNVLEDDVALYLKGGADMVLSKPLKMSELDMILRHVEEYGCQSVPEMKLVECFGKLSWVLK